MQLGPGIHRLGSGLVNSYLVEEAGEVTIIDAGLPGYYDDIPRELASMGRMITDVRAVLLTHGHSDHIGFAERLRSRHHVPVLVHEADAALARGGGRYSLRATGPIRFGPLLGLLWYGFRNGGLRTPKLQEVSTFGDGATPRCARQSASRPGPRTHAGECGAIRRSFRRFICRRCAGDLRSANGRTRTATRPF